MAAGVTTRATPPAQAADDPRAEALFVSCTALPVPGLIPALAAAPGKPVVSSNQAPGRAMLRAAGLRGAGPGRLFAPRPAAGPDPRPAPEAPPA